VLQRLGFGLAAGGLVFAVLGSLPVIADARKGKFFRATAEERRFAHEIDEAREEAGLPGLDFDPELARVSRKHTRAMARSEVLYHTPSGVFYGRVRNWRLIGENVGAGGSVSSLHQAFVASPDHLAIILHPRLEFVGVGVKHAGGRMWVTVTFSKGGNPDSSLPMRTC
jgi:uncharacterized protein YkwD